MKHSLARFDGVDGRKYSVTKSPHVNQKRGTSQFHRDSFITDEKYGEIMSLAVKNGLTQFRGKDPVCISFHDYKGRVFSILATLGKFEDKNEIFVITVFKGYVGYDFHTHFIKSHNRIYINENQFKLPYMSVDQHNENIRKRNVEVNRLIQKRNEARNRRARKKQEAEDERLYKNFTKYACKS